eukprot:gnl/Carplike_NY0171/9396_a13121_124.p1 GENE.gnl/Carplike_NY0171/9396_a13121_124~~gnl/Carplike_NY0171/9396_a13121_124.p1  ORF type:complete len:291 (+),score=64.02 gnl/Carplike_NY0171/9396_a13121_124:105-875(+)
MLIPHKKKRGSQGIDKGFATLTDAIHQQSETNLKKIKSRSSSMSGSPISSQPLSFSNTPSTVATDSPIPSIVIAAAATALSTSSQWNLQLDIVRGRQKNLFDRHNPSTSPFISSLPMTCGVCPKFSGRYVVFDLRRGVEARIVDMGSSAPTLISFSLDGTKLYSLTPGRTVDDTWTLKEFQVHEKSAFISFFKIKSTAKRTSKVSSKLLKQLHECISHVEAWNRSFMRCEGSKLVIRYYNFRRRNYEEKKIALPEQ